MGDQVWVTDRRHIVLGTVFRTLTQSEELADSASRLLAGFETTTRPARAQHILHITGTAESGLTVHRDCTRLANEVGPDQAMASYIAGLNTAAVAACRHFAVHAGVVARDGTAFAFPAESGQGKTTLTAALMRSGFDYLSDEALVLDDEGSVLPYPKPLALSGWSQEMLGFDPRPSELLVMPHELEGETGRRATLGHIIVARYGSTETSIQPLPRSQAVASLIEHSFNHYKNPQRAFRLATDAARKVKVWRLGYDDPLEAAQLIAAEIS